MNGTKTKYTPTEAIAVVNGLHRKRLYEMMANGDLTYEISDHGSRKKRLIDAAELIRVFGDSFRPYTSQEIFEENGERPTETETQPTSIGHLELEIRLLKERLESKNHLLEEKLRLIDDLRDERNEWRKQAQILLLPEGRPTIHKQSFWSRLLGGAT